MLPRWWAPVLFQSIPRSGVLIDAGIQGQPHLVGAVGFGNSIKSKRSRKLGPVTSCGSFCSGGNAGGAGQETGGGGVGLFVAQPLTKSVTLSSKGSELRMGFLLNRFNLRDKCALCVAGLCSGLGQGGLLGGFQLGGCDFVLFDLQRQAVFVPLELAAGGSEHGNKGGIDPAGDDGE